jgi:UDP-glucose-4-epimerase GalE
MNKNVLVTGGAGYIGSQACKVLKNNGFNPVTFDNLSTGHREFVKWGPFVEGDLLNQSDIELAIDEYDIQLVMHFAAKAYVNESVENPIKYYRENIQGSLNLLETFVKKNGKAIVFSSSCATYGQVTIDLVREDTHQSPINPYGFTKLAVERLLLDLAHIHKFSYSILRYFNAAGADSDLEIGEMHERETHVVPLLINAAFKNEVFKVYGNDYETPDGTAVRDYVHVEDIASAHLRALQIMIRDKQNIICNLGTGNGTSVLQLVNQIREWKKDFQYEFEPRREGDPHSLIAANQLSRNLLQMDYKKSRLELILKSAILWYEKCSSN